MKKKRRNRKKSSCLKPIYDNRMEVRQESVPSVDYSHWDTTPEMSGDGYGSAPYYASQYDHVQRDHVPSDYVNPSAYSYYDSSEQECFSLQYQLPVSNRHPDDGMQYRQYVSQYPSAGRHFEPPMDELYRRDVSIPAFDDLYAHRTQTSKPYSDQSRKMNNLHNIYSIPGRGYTESRPPVLNSYTEHRIPFGVRLPDQGRRAPFHNGSDSFVDGHL